MFNEHCSYSILKLYAVLNCILCQWGGSTQADCCGFGSLVLHCQPCLSTSRAKCAPFIYMCNALCSTSSAMCAPFICEIQCEVKWGDPAVSNLQLQKLIELWFCVLIDTLCIYCIVQWKGKLSCALPCTSYKLWVVLWGLCWLLWFCVHSFCAAFCIVQCKADSSLCVVLWGLCSAHADSCGFVWRGKSWGRRAVEEDTAPLIHNTIILFSIFAFLHLYFLLLYFSER